MCVCVLLEEKRQGQTVDVEREMQTKNIDKDTRRQLQTKRQIERRNNRQMDKQTHEQKSYKRHENDARTIYIKYVIMFLFSAHMF